MNELPNYDEQNLIPAKLYKSGDRQKLTKKRAITTKLIFNIFQNSKKNIMHNISQKYLKTGRLIWKHRLLFNNCRAAMLSKLYLTISGTLMLRLKSMGQFKMP